MGDLENDMDELFRKAANHYPLKTDGADWNKLMGKLPEAVGTPLPIIEQKADKSNKKLLWLILLFPMGWLCNSYFNNKVNNDKNNITITAVTSTKKIDNPLESADNQNYSKVITKEESSTSQTADDVNKVKATNNKSNTNTNISTNNNNNFNNRTQIVDNPQVLSNQKTFTINNTEKTLELKSATQKAIENKDGGDKLPQSFTQTQPVTIPQATIGEIKQLTDTSTMKLVVSAKEKDSPQPKNIDTAKKIAKKTENKTAIKSKGFYVSVFGGVDASSVKSQGIKKAGYSYGMMIGYNLNKHIAIETGLLWDKKQYYTDGEYFNKSRTTIPSNVTILDMNGNCSMFELPIAFRYNFGQNKKTLFFGTAGLSSYFMKNEGYDYQSQVNGGMPRYYAKTYNNSGNSIFSVIGVGIGYEHKIGKLVSLRINPYLNIPLKGIGIGSLPITSAGVNIGITVPFHK